MSLFKRSAKKGVDNLSERELEKALFVRRRSERTNRLVRLKDEGRVVEGASLGRPQESSFGEGGRIGQPNHAIKLQSF